MTKKQTQTVLGLLLGLFVALQVKAVNSGQKYLSMKDMYALSAELESTKRELEQLTEKKADLTDEISAYTTAKEDERVDYEQFLKDEIQWLKAASGFEPLAGPGVVVIVQDGSRALSEFEDPNNLIVHDLDIRSMVDDLRNAGAEAIAINGERILFNKTKIVCTGPTIQINDKAFAPPYVIQAIGDKDFLSAAVNAPGSFGDDLRKWGVFVEVNTSVHVEIPAYEASIF
ncbi:DUF881 domain-containing protein [Fusibacter sp. JL298sf-3]